MPDNRFTYTCEVDKIGYNDTGCFESSCAPARTRISHGELTDTTQHDCLKDGNYQGHITVYFHQVSILNIIHLTLSLIQLKQCCSVTHKLKKYSIIFCFYTTHEGEFRDITLRKTWTASY
jgi:hypothetical protein